MGDLNPSEVPKQRNAWKESWVIVTDGQASLKFFWLEGGTGTPPLGTMAESGVAPRRNPSSSIIAPLQRSTTCPAWPALPHSQPWQCPSGSPALFELHPSPIWTAPNQPGWRELLHYCNFVPPSLLIKAYPTVLVGLPFSFPSAVCESEQIWSFGCSV